MLKSNMLAEGGVMQEGGTVDPVSGNEVPVGSLKEEVRDDIDAKLSEGEFVFPADVVRYWGLEKLMMMRDKAKKGLQRMNEIGQMGNADQVPDAEALHGDEDEMDDDTFSSEIDSIIGEVDAESMGGTREFAAGGFAQPGTDYLAKYNIPKSSISNPALDVRAYKNAEGRLMYITFFNGKPSTPIPEGFTYVGTGQQMLTTKPEEDKKPDTPPDTTATGTPINDGGTGGDSSPTVGGTTSTDADGLATASTVSPTSVAIGLTGTAAALGFPAVASPTGMVTGFVTDTINSISHSIAAAANVAATGSPAAVDSHSQVSDTAPTATTGTTGTGGAAASAASSAAAAATAAGHGPAAVAAASQAAADAVVSGLDADAAANAAADAANAAAADAADAEGGGLGTAATGGEGGVSGVDGGGVSGIGADGIGFAKGGLVSKRKSAPKSTKQKGLASRR